MMIHGQNVYTSSISMAEGIAWTITCNLPYTAIQLHCTLGLSIDSCRPLPSTIYYPCEALSFSGWPALIIICRPHQQAVQVLLLLKWPVWPGLITTFRLPGGCRKGFYPLKDSLEHNYNIPTHSITSIFIKYLWEWIFILWYLRRWENRNTGVHSQKIKLIPLHIIILAINPAV